jgi:hypothetical protein
MNLNFLVITFITFIIFFLEALILFNFGKKAGKNEEEPSIYFNLYKDYNIYLPNKKKIMKISLTVLLFSVISGLLSTYLTN